MQFLATVNHVLKEISPLTQIFTLLLVCVVEMAEKKTHTHAHATASIYTQMDSALAHTHHTHTPTVNEVNMLTRSSGALSSIGAIGVDTHTCKLHKNQCDAYTHTIRPRQPSGLCLLWHCTNPHTSCIMSQVCDVRPTQPIVNISSKHSTQTIM